MSEFSQFSRRRFLWAAAGLLSCGPGLLAASADMTYLVRRGDTLTSIALRHGVSVRDLKSVNRLKGDMIMAGQRLKIPSAVSALSTVVDATDSIRLNRWKWKYIVGHHSAIRQGNAAIYDRNHRRRGMGNGLAYHFVIGNGVDSGDGEIEIGSRWLKQLDGGHVSKESVNERGIGICVVGNFQKTKPTRKQIASFTALVDYLGNDLLRGNYKFTVHKEVDRNHTVCPGRNFPTSTMHRKFN